MGLIELLRHTPTWVWILLVYLIFRGIKALQTREVAVQKLFYIPVLFLVWGFYGVFRETTWVAYTLFSMIIGLLIGGIIGAMLSHATGKPISSENHGMIIRPGSALPLIFMLLAFAAKYTLSVSVALHPELIASLSFNLIHGAISGVTAGIFWGSMLVYFIPWYRQLKRLSL
ncbi:MULTISPECIES: DUF6622 family protein [unclassified Pantoea]|uniref:DUF6622 family protein n=1 Tax=unclassified Pantoea TaxID=2630326 RepID=UPI001F1F7347|nr:MULTISPECIES: DUF6622 family protein [unclassified Pantoea]